MRIPMVCCSECKRIQGIDTGRASLLYDPDQPYLSLAAYKCRHCGNYSDEFFVEPEQLKAWLESAQVIKYHADRPVRLLFARRYGWRPVAVRPLCRGDELAIMAFHGLLWRVETPHDMTPQTQVDHFLADNQPIPELIGLPKSLTLPAIDCACGLKNYPDPALDDLYWYPTVQAAVLVVGCKNCRRESGIYLNRTAASILHYRKGFCYQTLDHIDDRLLEAAPLA